MARKAVIVAAGLSSRLYPLTSETPKMLLPIGDETLLGRSMRLLGENGVQDIAVVVGFRADSIRKAVGDAATIIPNPFYRQCNNMGSLMMAKNYAGNDPFVYLHGDLVYGENMLGEFLAQSAQHPGVPRSREHSRGTTATGSCLDLLVAFGDVDEEGMKVRAGGDGRLIESNKAIPLNEAAGEWTGIAVVQKPAIVFEAMEQHMMDVSLTDYDTAAFTTLAQTGHEVRCIAANNDPWKEIDTFEDLEAARAAFGTSG
jgi:choline kinase